MPIYEYACTSCEHKFDVRHGADEKPKLDCPQCQSDVRKVFHAAGIIFKGSGWYITDNGGNGKSAVLPEAKTESQPAPAVETKTETKVEAKTETKTG